MERRQQGLQAMRVQLGSLGHIFSMLLQFLEWKNEAGTSPHQMLLLGFVFSLEGEALVLAHVYLKGEVEFLGNQHPPTGRVKLKFTFSFCLAVHLFLTLQSPLPAGHIVWCPLSPAGFINI